MIIIVREYYRKLQGSHGASLIVVRRVMHLSRSILRRNLIKGSIVNSSWFCGYEDVSDRKIRMHSSSMECIYVHFKLGCLDTWD